MPTISTFYGIIVRMYYAPREHGPPHFHVYCGDHSPLTRWRCWRASYRDASYVLFRRGLNCTRMN
jgi:hypothetical protein